MRRGWTLIVLAGLVLAASDCNCEDVLESSVGELYLELCDRGDVCGCRRLDPTASLINFGSPGVGQNTERALRVINDNQPLQLVIRGLSIAPRDAGFRVTRIERRTSDAADAEVTNVPFDQLPLTLVGKEEAVVYVAFEPAVDGEATATLTVDSNSSTRPNWPITLTGGAGSSDVTFAGAPCGAGCSVDFGTFNKSELRFDPAVGLPVALGGPQVLTVTNTGQADLFLRAQLTDDGIPERSPSEQVGDFGIFFLDELGCSIIAPGESMDVTVYYRPSSSGEHFGEVTLLGFGEPLHVPLIGRVIGATICFRTEDQIPEDLTLQFGDPPTYAVPQNSSETRTVWIGNCGFQEDLQVDALSWLVGGRGYSTTRMPLVPSVVLPPPDANGGVVAEEPIPVQFAPVGPVGALPEDRLAFDSNDSLNPTAYVTVTAGIGPPEQCMLVASPGLVDFGWVARDDATRSTCTLGSMGCPGFGGELYISRIETFTLMNVGQRDCSNISFDAMVERPGNYGSFTFLNPPTSALTLTPGQRSDPFQVLFTQPPDPGDPSRYLEGDNLGRLPYRSPQMPFSPVDIDLFAHAGGSPYCDLVFDPVSVPSGCSEPALNFGRVNIGTERTVDLRVGNLGGDTCTITAVRFTGNGDGMFGVAPLALPMVIEVNRFDTVPVTFAPVPPSGSDPFAEVGFGCMFDGIGGIFGGGGQPTIDFSYFSGASGPTLVKNLDLAGKGARPDIDVIPGEIDFGDVAVGCCSASIDVSIYNSGDGTLTITSLDLLGGTAGFEVSRTIPPGTQDVPPGGSTSFTVRFCPNREGLQSEQVEIVGNDDTGEFFTVNMTGNGTLDHLGHDNYQQPARPMVDVLWVVDDSGSMGEEQDNLANNFTAFIDTAVTLDTDYHIGVVTTDSQSEWAGKLYSCEEPPRWIHDRMAAADQQRRFRCNVQVTDSGRPSSDSKESALQAARLALEYPNIDDYNLGFYRDEAKLYIILVTDERDQSDGTAAQYVDFFRNLKGLGNPDLLNISAITGPVPDGCATAEANQMDYDAVSAVGGQFRSICSADWSDLIATLGLDVFNARRQFPLSRPTSAANISTVMVCEDDGTGNPDMSRCTSVSPSATNGWTFDPALNTLTFNGTSIPGPSQHVVVDYAAVCCPDGTSPTGGDCAPL